jgi:hypothetical protein
MNPPPQIIEDGRLADSKGRHVDFKNTLIVMYPCVNPPPETMNPSPLCVNPPPETTNPPPEILEDGRLTNSKERHVDFKNTLIVMRIYV